MMKVLTFETLVCKAIRTRVVVEFDYDGLHRVVHPYCHGTTRKGQDSLRAVQIAGESRSGALGYGKLWTFSKIRNLLLTEENFTADDPEYNPDDEALVRIHCRIEK
jgi:hypothetical protein